MNAISPFSLFDPLVPAKMLGRVAGEIAESAKGHNGLAGAFSAAWTGLDANKDGALDAKDVLGHAVGARNAVLRGIADVLGYETPPAASATGAGGQPAGVRVDGAGPIMSGHGTVAQTLVAGAPPALPSAPAARAVENLPGIAEIRAGYAVLRTLH